MGCWNGTCGITQMAITRNEKIRLVIITGGGSTATEGAGIHYIDDVWHPVSVPIRGKYNEYGSITDIVQDRAAELLLEQLKEIYPEEERTKVTLESAINDIEREKFNGYGMFFILEPIYQAMLAYNYISYVIEGDLRTYVPMREVLQARNQKEYLELVETLSVIKEDSFMYYRLSNKDEYQRSSNGNLPCLKKWAFKMAKLNMNIEDSEVQEFLNISLDWHLLTYAMRISRKLWMPQAGRGSQGDGDDLLKLINIACNKYIDARQKKRDKDFGESSKKDKNGFTRKQREHNKRIKKDS